MALTDDQIGALWPKRLALREQMVTEAGAVIEPWTHIVAVGAPKPNGYIEIAVLDGPLRGETFHAMIEAANYALGRGR
jgi:hypothetical protein